MSTITAYNAQHSTQHTHTYDVDDNQARTLITRMKEHMNAACEEFQLELAREAMAQSIEAKQEISSRDQLFEEIEAIHPYLQEEYGTHAPFVGVMVGMIGTISNVALAGNFKKLLLDGSIDNTLGLYATAWRSCADVLERIPSILTYDEITTVCGEYIVSVDLTVECPLCGSDMEAIGPCKSTLHGGEYIGLECKSCQFSPLLDVNVISS